MVDVTIIIPNYNHGDYIIQRLDTIAFQTYTQWEAIIIDDASNDNSANYIETYLKNHVKFKVKHFIKNELNSGSGYISWLKGFELAETEYIWIAETDDYSDPSFLETTISALKANSKAALAFTASNYVDSHGKFLYTTSKRLAKLHLDSGQSKIFKGQVIIEDFPLQPLITNGSAVVFRKPKTQIPKDLFLHKQLSDIFLWTLLLKDTYFIYINKELNYFRRHDQSTTTVNYAKHKEEIYVQYCKYVSYFKQESTKAKRIIDHYVKHFLIPNRKKVGYLYLQPIEGLYNVSRLGMVLRIMRGYFNHIFKRIVS